jgi:hypothetical protein
MRALLMISAGMLGLLKGALSRLQKRVAKAEGFYLQTVSWTICAVWRCCSPHLACLWHYPLLPQTNPGHGSVFGFDYEEALRGLSHLLRLAGTLLGTNRLQGPTGTVFEIERNFGKIPPLWGYFSLPLPQRQVR